MSNKLLKLYPPYEGDEPFVFLCFAEADSSYVEPLLSKLWTRGCRVWYTSGNSTDIAQEKRVQNRMKKAGLVIAVCSEAFHKDDSKSRMMVLQSKNVPIISVDREQTDNLSAGFREGTPHIKAYMGISGSTEAELISTDGFSQSFIGERREAPRSKTAERLFKVMLMLTAAAALAFALVFTGIISPSKEEPAEEVRVISLDKLPSDLSELEKYPQLEKIIIPQAEAENAEALIGRYTIVVRGA